MADVVVPDPEPNWQPAASPPYLTGRNPASQFGLWWYISGDFRLIAGLSPSLESLAKRLRLHIEHSWEDLGDVDLALFRIQKIHFILCRMPAAPTPDVRVFLHREHTDIEGALDILLDTLGTGRSALTFVGDETGEFGDLHAGKPSET